MLQKQRKNKGPMNNIHININLNVQSKNAQLIGKKISHTNEINTKNNDINKLHTSTQNANKKKISIKQHWKTKKSVQEFVNLHTISYEDDASDHEDSPPKYNAKLVTARPDIFKKTDRKKMKSKSSQNLRLGHYGKNMIKAYESPSRSKSKSITKKKHESPKSFIKSGKQRKSHSKELSYSKSKNKSLLQSRSKSKSMSKSKSRSKSPLHINKKKSLQIFKTQDNTSFKIQQKAVPKTQKKSKSREKNMSAAKIVPNVFLKQKQKSQVNVHKKYSCQIKKQLSKKNSESDVKVPKRKSEGCKSALVSSQQTKIQPKRQKSVKEAKKNNNIYHAVYLSNMATKIQSICRGYLARMKFKNQLNQQSDRFSNIKDNINKLSQNWQAQSDNSIICINSEHFNITEKQNYPSSNPSNRQEHQAIMPKKKREKDIPLIVVQVEEIQKKKPQPHRYKFAQPAEILKNELQEKSIHLSIVHQLDIQIQNKKQNYNSLNGSNLSSRNNSPSSRRMPNMNINVDEIDFNSKKYHPIIINHHQQNRFESQQEHDLSQLYKKAMSDKIESKKIQILPIQQNRFVILHQRSPEAIKSPKNQVNQHKQVDDGNQIKQEQPLKVKEQKGFSTNLCYIKQFYVKFCQFFRQIPNFKQEILSNLSNEITFDMQLYLKSYRASIQLYDKNQLIFPYFKQLATYDLAIPVHILNSFYQEQTNSESAIFSKECSYLKQSSKEQYEAHGFSYYELKQYHDLALIDAFNQALNYARPGGAQASNLDILTQDYHVICQNRVKGKFEVDFDEQLREYNLDTILGNGIAKVINYWACTLCGFLNDSQEPQDFVDQQKLEEIRQVRLTLMLERTLVEEEINIINMSAFKFYIKYQLEANIFDHLINETIQNIVSLSKIKQKNFY